MKNTVSAKEIDATFDSGKLLVSTVLDKTTIVSFKHPNGFVIVESSSCVDAANYDEQMGKQICVERIKNKLWELQGFLLQEKIYQSERIQKDDPAEDNSDLKERNLRGMDFSEALLCLKESKRVAREGWNRKGLHVEMDIGGDYEESELLPFLIIRNVRGSYNTWVPSISDLFATDWIILED